MYIEHTSDSSIVIYMYGDQDTIGFTLTLSTIQNQPIKNSDLFIQMLGFKASLYILFLMFLNFNPWPTDLAKKIANFQTLANL